MDKEEKKQRVTKVEWIAMISVIVAVAIAALHANWQKFRKDKIESVTVQHFTPSPGAASSVRPRPTP